MAVRDIVGRLLLSVAVISVVTAPLAADLNETHIFNDAWPPHARFHNAVVVFTSSGLTLIGLWLLWRKTSEFRTHLFLAMLIPVVSWGAFFPALLIPGTGVEDVPGELPRVLGMALNLFVALMFVLLSLVGWLLSLTAHRRPDAPYLAGGEADAGEHEADQQ